MRECACISASASRSGRPGDSDPGRKKAWQAIHRNIANAGDRTYDTAGVPWRPARPGPELSAARASDSCSESQSTSTA